MRNTYLPLVAAAVLQVIIFLAFGLWIYYEHDRITLTQDKIWEDNREIERHDNCINDLYQKVKR